MKCVICASPADSVDEVMEQNWVSAFFEGESEHGPVCPFCSGALLRMAPDGEYELKDNYKGRVVFNDSPVIFDEEPFEDVVLGFILN